MTAPLKGNRIKDSGSRREFDSGAVRDNSLGKGRFDLIPIYPLFEVAKHYEWGQLKYPPDANKICPTPDDENWKKGMDVCGLLNSSIRHILKMLANLDDEPHGAAAIWGILNVMETLRLIQEGVLPQHLDNRGRGTPLEYLMSETEKEKALDTTTQSAIIP